MTDEPRRDRLGTPVDEQPDGPLSGTFYRYTQELYAAQTHALHEGIEADPRAVLDSYDRNCHPWMHGRRPHDIARRLRSWWPW